MARLLCRTAFVLAVSIAMVATASAATFIASQNGNWSSAATWANAGVPGAADTAIINAGITVTIDAAVTVATLTQSGALIGAQPDSKRRPECPQGAAR